MSIEGILAAIDAEIAKLQQARQLLSNSTDVPTKGKKRDRPKGTRSTPSPEKPATKRTMSPEGRARVAAAQRKRHAAKNQAAKKVANGE